MLNSALFCNLTICISTIIEWLIFKFILDRFNERKKSKLIINISISLIIILIIILTIVNVNVNIKLIIAVVIGYIFYIYNYKCNLLKGLIISSIYWMMLVGVDFISVNFVLIINSSMKISELLKSDVSRLELVFISKLLLVSIIPIVKNLKYNIELKKTAMLYTMIPVIANILSIVAIYTLAIQCVNRSHAQKSMLFIIASILILSNISLIKIIGGIIKSNNIKIENKLIKEKMKMQYNNYITI